MEEIWLDNSGVEDWDPRLFDSQTSAVGQSVSVSPAQRHLSIVKSKYI